MSGWGWALHGPIMRMFLPFREDEGKGLASLL
jgi:hypothetical protein